MNGPNAANVPSDPPVHARERLAAMREHRLFTRDLSVNEFLLVKEAGFDPLGLVMGTSIYQIAPRLPALQPGQPGCEIVEMTHALYHAREIAMNRREEEADALGADGIVGVRLEVNLTTDPTRQQWTRYLRWQDWAWGVGYSVRSSSLGMRWAVAPMGMKDAPPKARLVMLANDEPPAAAEGDE